MLLSRIAEELCVPFFGNDVEICSIEYNSKRVEAGALFGCIVGLVSDGHNFAKQAVDKGAVALICERPLNIDVPQLIVSDARSALAEAAACFYEHPERSMHMLAVTGTNGKTSTTYMVKSIAEAAGKKVGLIGTIVNLIGDERIDTARTTPESADLFALLRHMANEGCDLVIMEVSSHALVQDRVHGIMFDAGLFTNLTQDHLDYHKTFENYLNAKKLLFRQSKVAIINIDDPMAESMKQGLTIPILSMGIQNSADYRASGIDITTSGVTFHLHTPHGDGRINLHISGLFSVYNAMGAAALMDCCGYALKDIIAGLGQLSGVAGRLQSVNTFAHSIAVYVDYAHTPDALENVLTTVHGFAKARVIVVFGCGGDRDKAKRPIMGEIGGRHSDYAIITSDNPRTEDPMTIISEVEAGVKRTGTPYVVIENRAEAIGHALQVAKENDIIVIAGKGHENYQEINGVKHHFDDKEVVEELLSKHR
ncbi:MAG: UDP-N-acetylmuramoyl-L-alanyl-D-glutamate--2,6-diaminopimelate ligase [Eubacteriales bacterium]|nr:UDP-N-acetylmuramoyl-L-alanyl-D-glutamate--2,6-diaminopimelate ligase [Eubacteriales bacterium]